MKRAFLLAALLTLGVATSGPTVVKGAADRPGPLPGDAQWDYGAWANDYLVAATDYDPSTKQVTWTLEARRKVKGQGYQARFTDACLVELDVRNIQFTPAQTEYRKGTRIKATMKLPAKDVMQDTNRVVIDAAR